MVSQILIGTYRLGNEHIRLYASTTNSSAAFWSVPENKEMPKMVIGMKDNDWQETLTNLLHEAMELTCYRMELRYAHASRHCQASDTFFFFMDHRGLSEAVARVSYFLADCIDDLKKCYENHKPNKPPKTNRRVHARRRPMRAPKTIIRYAKPRAKNPKG